MLPARREDAELKRLYDVKRAPAQPSGALGPELVSFFKQSVQKRQTKLAKIAECWERLVPPMLAEHCALDSLKAGALTVLVDSSAHLYDLKQLLLAGLQQELLVACRSAGLRKITLRAGRWYEANEGGERRPRFD